MLRALVAALGVAAVAAVLGVAVLVAACGSSRTGQSAVAAHAQAGAAGRSAAAAHARAGAAGRSAVAAHARVGAASCITGSDYGGLGARASSFDANNDNSTGPAGPTPGAAWYQVLGVANGCVTAYAVQDSAAPPLRATDMLGLLSPYLPRDARQVAHAGTCLVWESEALGRATGLRFASATAISQVGSLMSGSAEIKATAHPACNH